MYASTALYPEDSLSLGWKGAATGGGFDAPPLSVAFEHRLALLPFYPEPYRDTEIIRIYNAEGFARYSLW